jgi:hypothetical protein
LTRYRIEVEQVTRGFIEVELHPGEALYDLRARARDDVEDGLLVPLWEPDEVQVTTGRLYDAEAKCRQEVGATTHFCAVHQEPMKPGLDICWRWSDDRAEDLVADGLPHMD